MIDLADIDKETVIIQGLMSNDNYTRIVLPFLKEEYFVDRYKRVLYNYISEYYTEYNNAPTMEICAIGLEQNSDLTDVEFGELLTNIKQMSSETPTDNQQWLVDMTEAYCQERSIYIGIMTSIDILEGDDKKRTPQAIPEILSDALAVSFDKSIGLDFLRDNRYDFYRRTEEKIPFGLSVLNLATGGGIPRKTLSCVLAGTGVGKTMFMTDQAKCHLVMGHSVLYITMEMAEERIAERIDANMMDISLSDLKTIDRDVYNAKFDALASQARGQLIIKEYPTVGASVSTFKHLLHELKIKKKFVPDLIYIDYINICASSRLKGYGDNTYVYVKSVAEELRGLAVESNTAIITATQTNRTGSMNSDPEMSDTSDSFGLPMTLDLYIALINSEELQQANKLIIKQLKNRFGDITDRPSFAVGVDRSKMRLFDDQSSNFESMVDVHSPSPMNVVPSKVSAAARFDDFKM